MVKSKNVAVVVDVFGLDVRFLMDKTFYTKLSRIKYVTRNKDRKWCFWLVGDRPTLNVESGEWFGSTGYAADELLTLLHVDKKALIKEFPHVTSWKESLMVIKL